MTLAARVAARHAAQTRLAALRGRLPEGVSLQPQGNGEWGIVGDETGTVYGTYPERIDAKLQVGAFNQGGSQGVVSLKYDLPRVASDAEALVAHVREFHEKLTRVVRDLALFEAPMEGGRQQLVNFQLGYPEWLRELELVADSLSSVHAALLDEMDQTQSVAISDWIAAGDGT